MTIHYSDYFPVAFLHSMMTETYLNFQPFYQFNLLNFPFSSPFLFLFSFYKLWECDLKVWPPLERPTNPPIIFLHIKINIYLTLVQISLNIPASFFGGQCGGDTTLVSSTPATPLVSSGHGERRKTSIYEFMWIIKTFNQL